MTARTVLPLSQEALDAELAALLRAAHAQGHRELGLHWWPNGAISVECRACQASELVHVMPVAGEHLGLPPDPPGEALRRYRCLYAVTEVPRNPHEGKRRVAP